MSIKILDSGRDATLFPPLVEDFSTSLAPISRRLSMHEIIPKSYLPRRDRIEEAANLAAESLLHESFHCVCP